MAESKVKNTDLKKMLLTIVTSVVIGGGGGSTIAYNMSKADVKDIAQAQINTMLVDYNARIVVVERQQAQLCLTVDNLTKELKTTNKNYGKLLRLLSAKFGVPVEADGE